VTFGAPIKKGVDNNGGSHDTAEAVGVEERIIGSVSERKKNNGRKKNSHRDNFKQ